MSFGNTAKLSSRSRVNTNKRIKGHDFGQKKPKRHQSKQLSCIFVQFLDSIWQLWDQFPTSFEFDNNLLLFLIDSLYSQRFGNFLSLSEKERKASKLTLKTNSAWGYVYANMHTFINTLYNKNARGKSSLLPNVGQVKFWSFYFLRWSTYTSFKEAEDAIRNMKIKQDQKDELRKLQEKEEQQQPKITEPPVVVAPKKKSKKKSSKKSKKNKAATISPGTLALYTGKKKKRRRSLAQSESLSAREAQPEEDPLLAATNKLLAKRRASDQAGTTQKKALRKRSKDVSYTYSSIASKDAWAKVTPSTSVGG